MRETRVRAVLGVSGEFSGQWRRTGRGIIGRQARDGWRANEVDRLAADPRAEFPGSRGSSPATRCFMRAFAAAWPDPEIHQRVIGGSPGGQNIELLAIAYPANRAWDAESAVAESLEQAGARRPARDEGARAPGRRACPPCTPPVRHGGPHDRRFALMFDAVLAPLSPTVRLGDPRLLASLERASAAIARMDQALDGHPLLAAFLYRTRLEAVRRQAAVDGHGIDPWHLAAVLEGLRLRMDGALRIIDRGTIFDAARTALGHHQWLTAPDFDQEGEVAVAETHIAARPAPTALLTAALRFRSWLDQGGTRPPVRAALIRHWVRSGLLRAPVPLTGPRALSADAPEEPTKWTCAFLDAIAAEASDYHQMLRDLERGWTAARRKTAGRRSTSRGSIAIDVLAAAPLLSATTLAGAIGMSIEAATELFDAFVDEGIAVEVTHRSARRLFGLIGMAPVREVTTAPRRPQPGRGRGRPAFVGAEDEAVQAAPIILPPLTRFERPAIDYAALEEAMAQCEQVIRSTKRTLDRLRDGD